MSSPTKSLHELARRLLAAEAAERSAGDPHEATLVCEKLRVSLTRFAGADGFNALMRRALALARADAAWLKGVKLDPDGCLEGFLELKTSESESREGAAAITAHLLSLLVTFVGEQMTRRLVRDAWPDAPLDD